MRNGKRRNGELERQHASGESVSLRLSQGYARLRVSVKEDSGVCMLCKVTKVKR